MTRDSTRYGGEGKQQPHKGKMGRPAMALPAVSSGKGTCLSKEPQYRKGWQASVSCEAACLACQCPRASGAGAKAKATCKARATNKSYYCNRRCRSRSLVLPATTKPAEPIQLPEQYSSVGPHEPFPLNHRPSNQLLTPFDPKSLPLKQCRTQTSLRLFLGLQVSQLARPRLPPRTFPPQHSEKHITTRSTRCKAVQPTETKTNLPCRINAIAQFVF